MAPVRRCMKYDPSLVPDGGKEVVCHVAGPAQIGYKEPAGHFFHQKVLRQQGLIRDAEPSDDEDATSASESGRNGSASRSESQNLDDQPPADVNWKGSKGKKRKVKKRADGDFYALLGLQHERWTATETQLRNAYRRTCLENHPDKKMAGVTDEDEKTRIEEKFKLIQEAYGVLSDPAKRREYDSTDDFDDTLPSECLPSDFFKVFAPAFRRNARWSVDSNVPDCGDDNTPYDQVEKFYNFWFGFKSWREFPHPDEEDAEGAESREHRRWIERNNSKLREKGKKDEQKRLREFVDTAYKIDPRIQRKKDEDRMERERKKQEKEDARRRQQEEEERVKAEEEAARKAAEEEAKRLAEEAKKAREAQKRMLKKEKTRLKALVATEDGNKLIEDSQLEKLTTRLEQETLAILNDTLESASNAELRTELLTKKLAELDESDAAEAAKKEAQRKEAEAASKDATKREHARKFAEMREWNEEEMRMLDKAVAKFPQGTPKRWEAVTAYVRTRTLDEVLLMVKEKQGASAARMKAQEDWKGAQKKRAEVRSQADTRANAFTDVEVNLQGEAVKLMEGITPALATPAATVDASAAVSSPTAAPKKVVSASSGEWNEEQELALVKALKAVGKDAEDRWEQVSKLVPGKTKAQCFKRFKELKEVFKSKKAGGDE